MVATRLATLCVLLLGTALAQDPSKPPPQVLGPPDNFGQLLGPTIEKKLGLNAEQQERLEQLRAEFKEKCLALRDRTQAAVDKIRAAAMKEGKERDRSTSRQLRQEAVDMMRGYAKLRDVYDPKLRGLFTEDQKKQYEELLREKKAAPVKDKKP
jgi:hypothetical protein